MFGRKQEEKPRIYELSDFVNDLNKVLERTFPYLCADDSYTPYPLVLVSGYYKGTTWHWKFSCVPSMTAHPGKEIKRIIRKVGADMAEVNAYGKIESRPLANLYGWRYEENLKNWNADEGPTEGPTFTCCERICWNRARCEE